MALAPDVAEIAFALGAGDRVVAAPPAADYPPAARLLRRVDPGDVEAVVSLRPDLALATTAGNDPRVIERLRAVGVRVLTVDVTSFDRLAAACALVGSALGRAGEGETLAREIAARCDALRRRAASLPRRGALYVVWWDPLIVAAPGTFHDDLLRRAALDNLAAAGAGRYPRVDPETLLDPRLEVIVAPDESDVRVGFARILPTPAGARLASGALRVLWLPADPASRPAPRLVDALEALVAARQNEETGPGPGGQGPAPPPEDRQTGSGVQEQGSGVRGQGSNRRPPNSRDETPRSAGRAE